jgi:hypothetical protein
LFLAVITTVDPIKIAIILRNLLSSFLSLVQKPTTHQELLCLIEQAADEQWEELDLSGMGRSELPKSMVSDRPSVIKDSRRTLLLAKLFE